MVGILYRMNMEGNWRWFEAEGLAGLVSRGIPWWVGAGILGLMLVLPNLMAARLSKLWLGIPGLDKPTHFFAFLTVFLVVYGMLHGRMWPGSKRERLGLAVCISLILALADEVQQAVLGIGRTAEYGDLVADAAGIFVGLTGITTGQLGVYRSLAIMALLLVPVAAVTAHTYKELKHYHRGMVYEREHDYQRARAEYQLALESGFQSAELFNAIAWLDIEFLGADPDRTEEYAARAFALDPDNPDILDTYGWVLVKAGRPRDGLTLLEKAKRLKPNMYCIDLHLGVAYREVGDRNRAAEFLKRQIERSVTDRWGRSAKVALDQLEGRLG